MRSGSKFWKAKVTAGLNLKLEKTKQLDQLFAWLFSLVKDYIKILNTVEHAYVITVMLSICLCKTIGNVWYHSFWSAIIGTVFGYLIGLRYRLTLYKNGHKSGFHSSNWHFKKTT